MPQEPENSPQGFQWRTLQAFSDLLNRLGRHGFRAWPESKEDLTASINTLRLDPETDILLLGSDESPCGYALTLVELDIDRAVASVALEASCRGEVSVLLDFIEKRSHAAGVSKIHVASRGAAVEPVVELKKRGYRQVNANLELALKREHASGIVDIQLPNGFSLRPMRSSTELLLLTRVQNTVFDGHWGFSQNSPQEIQAKLDLPSTGPEHVLFLESREGDIAGYIWTALVWDSGHTCGQIWMTGVMPEFRSKGLGTSVVNAGIKHLFANGAADIHLEVMENNAAAVQIYTGMGFAKTGRTDWLEKQL